MTTSEKERAAYIAANTPLAHALAHALAVGANFDDAVNECDSAREYITEARGCFPGEDCLHKLVAYVLGMKLTKFARTELTAQIEELQSALAQSGEYGISEIDNALTSLERVQL